uniref:Putative jockey ele1 orf2-h 1e-120-j 4 n=1 Tax=Ixodes ricinus TaxID=34613 RepID=A0A0K8R3W3_IXORI
MTLNFNKCKSLSFTRSSHASSFSYHLSTIPVATCSSYKYLGVHLTSDLSWTTHINAVTADANRAFGFLRRNLRLATPSVKLLAYTTLVRSKLKFASSIWSPWQSYLTNNLESVQNRGLRFIYSDYSPYTSISGLRKSANLDLLSLRRRGSRLTLLHKIF